jgi:two-component system OmpR family sensor kinase
MSASALLNRAAAAPGRLRRAQLRTRVLVGVLLVTLAALLAFDFAAVAALRGYLLGQTDSQLHAVLGLYRPVQVTEVLTPASRATRSASALSAINRAQRSAKDWKIAGPVVVAPRILGQFYVASLHGGSSPRQFVSGNPSLRPRAVAASITYIAGRGQAATVFGESGRNQLRLLAQAFPGKGTVYATTSLAGVNKTLDHLELIVAIGSAVAGLLAAGGVAWIVRRGLRPIEAMAGAADRITAGDLDHRVSPHDPGTEVGRLGTALNGMLARIEAAVREREASQELTRRFFADASHELRNPLASLRANAELYQQGALPGREQVDEAMRRIGLEAQRMSGLVDDMLRLARLDQRPGQEHEPVDLTALVTGCAERTRVACAGRTWRTRISGGLETTGDEELLRRAVDNLLANVHAHTPPEATGTITADRDGDTITIQVSDTGPGVPDDELPRIFDRFYRAGAKADRQGTGLGLAIVAATATAHNGAAHAARNHPSGLRVTLTLPGD